MAEAFWHTFGFLERCVGNRVILRPDKLTFCK